jgi:hypothetical protein
VMGFVVPKSSYKSLLLLRMNKIAKRTAFTTLRPYAHPSCRFIRISMLSRRPQVLIPLGMVPYDGRKKRRQIWI